MKTRSIVIISSGLILAVIAIFASVLFFPLKESDLIENTLKTAGKLYSNNISNYTVLDSKFSNNNIAFIYRFELENGIETSYAVSYYKHFLFPRYRFASYADYSRPDFSGVLIATGMPYETVYDISEHSLKYKDSALNYNLIKIICGFIIAVLLIIVLLGKQLYTKKSL